VVINADGHELVCLEVMMCCVGDMMDRHVHCHWHRCVTWHIHDVVGDMAHLQCSASGKTLMPCSSYRQPRIFGFT